MKCNTQIVGAVLAGIGAVFLANYIQNISTQKRKVVTKKLAKEAVQSWEGEGGAIVERAPRTSAA
jgi:hypothetical protein